MELATDMSDACVLESAANCLRRLREGGTIADSRETRC